MNSLHNIRQHLLRPPGLGIPIFSAGATEAEQFSKKYSQGKSWSESWARLDRAKVVLIGVPMDTGAGIRRGAMYGPRALRETLLERGSFRELLVGDDVVDLGDIYVNPHLLHDVMLSDRQIRLCQDSMYSSATAEQRALWPVSPLSQLQYVLMKLLTDYPHLRPMVLGGDHSLGHAVSQALIDRHGSKKMGILQPDAHTDLLPSRLGVEFCFGTWSYHANESLGRGGRLVQIGIRQTGRDRGHWESELGVRQYWQGEWLGKSGAEVARDIVAHFQSIGVDKLYFSNDVDGTDVSFVSATGTPAAGGFSPSFLLDLIEEVSNHISFVGADCVEVAPSLAKDPHELESTLEVSADFIEASIRALRK